MTTAQILNQLGLIFDFSAFWLGSFELLGENRLARYETAIERKLLEPLESIGDLTSALIFWSTVLFPLVVFLGMIVSLVIGAISLAFPALGATGTLSFNVYLISFCGSAILWLAVVLLLPRVTTRIAVVARNLLRQMRDDAKLRQRWLRYGAISLSLGFALQFGSGFFR